MFYPIDWLSVIYLVGGVKAEDDFYDVLSRFEWKLNLAQISSDVFRRPLYGFREKYSEFLSTEEARLEFKPCFISHRLSLHVTNDRKDTHTFLKQHTMYRVHINFPRLFRPYRFIVALARPRFPAGVIHHILLIVIVLLCSIEGSRRQASFSIACATGRLNTLGVIISVEKHEGRWLLL